MRMMKAIRRSMYRRKQEIDNHIELLSSRVRNYFNPLIFERVQMISQKAFDFENEFSNNRLSRKFVFLRYKQCGLQTPQARNSSSVSQFQFSKS
jgi:hypothetical protein